MPGLDRTGPRGEGARTGWGTGKCKPAPGTDAQNKQDLNDDPEKRPGNVYGRGFGNRYDGGGRGLGRGRGRGKGTGRGFGRGR